MLTVTTGAEMKFAFPLPHMLRLKAITQPWEAGVTGADQTRMVKRAEAMGYDMIAIPEHFVIPDEHVELPVRTTSSMVASRVLRRWGEENHRR
jgi:hypothetical protein